ncbi:hypothetical protein NE570_18820 [Eubacterium callanderi]|nr:hypothetical protein [Eubacterium callanderi]
MLKNGKKQKFICFEVCAGGITLIYMKKSGFLKKIPPEIPKTPLKKSGKRVFGISGGAWVGKRCLAGAAAEFLRIAAIRALLPQSLGGSAAYQRKIH